VGLADGAGRTALLEAIGYAQATVCQGQPPRDGCGVLLLPPGGDLPDMPDRKIVKYGGLMAAPRPGLRAIRSGKSTDLTIRNRVAALALSASILVGGGSRPGPLSSCRRGPLQVHR